MQTWHVAYTRTVRCTHLAYTVYQHATCCSHRGKALARNRSDRDGITDAHQEATMAGHMLKVQPWIAF
jgi:hypothetical protein